MRRVQEIKSWREADVDAAQEGVAAVRGADVAYRHARGSVTADGIGQLDAEFAVVAERRFERNREVRQQVPVDVAQFSDQRVFETGAADPFESHRSATHHVAGGGRGNHDVLERVVVFDDLL